MYSHFSGQIHSENVCILLQKALKALHISMVEMRLAGLQISIVMSRCVLFTVIIRAELICTYVFHSIVMDHIQQFKEVFASYT